MRDLSEKVCLIIPCYNEANRIDFEKFNKYKSNCYFLFVNDGSKDNTLEVLKKNIKENMFILNIEQNVGKAEAVRRGILFTKTLSIFDKVEWVGYWDADLAASLNELSKFLMYCNLFDNRVDAVWGSRVYKLGSNIKRIWKRHICGRMFATAAKIVLHVESYDSQCGAKIFRKQIIDEFCSEPFISKWIFDIEILLRLKKYNIVEYPLLDWTDISGGKLNVMRVALTTLIEIGKIKAKYYVKGTVGSKGADAQ